MDGSQVVESTGMYRLHQGEKVTPRGLVEGGEGVQVTIINQIDGQALNSMLADDPNTILNIIGQDVAEGGVMHKSILSLMRNR